MEGSHAFQEVRSPLSYCPRSSLPVEVLRWLAERRAHLCPARRGGQGGTPPLPLEVRLDVLGAVVLDGLSYRRAARMVGICKTEVGEAVCVDGLATRVQRPGGWPTRRSWMTPSGAPTPPRAWRCRPSTAICCGVMVASPGAAMSTSCWRSRACVRPWTPPASPPWSTGDSEGWRRSARAGTRRSGTDAPKTSARRRTRPQPPPGRAARPGGAGDRTPGQRVDAAALAWPAVPGPGRLPGRRGAHLPRPMDPPHPDMKEASGHPH